MDFFHLTLLFGFFLMEKMHYVCYTNAIYILFAKNWDQPLLQESLQEYCWELIHVNTEKFNFDLPALTLYGQKYWPGNYSI